MPDAQGQQINDDLADAEVDAAIEGALTDAERTSFFLYAGAGSGKTRSLVTAVDGFRQQHGRRLSLERRKIGVITYTNAACDEINQRLAFDARVHVSTIHSFAWTLIGGFHADIREWLRGNLAIEIAEIEEAQRKGRAGKASEERARSIESKTARLADLDQIRKFVYSPTGDNFGRDALNHSEVIKIASEFMIGKETLQRILIDQYPVMLIDESQDTNKHFMEAMLCVEAKNVGKFRLGLFGDTMQRIYADGKTDLGKDLPPHWRQPVKKMNHRCPKRVVDLINRIRSDVDGQTQMPRADKSDGTVRLFIVDEAKADKATVEQQVMDTMAKLTGDEAWLERGQVKTLILEHHMAARRFGFEAMFEPIYRIGRSQTGLLDGTLSELAFFSRDVLPLVRAIRAGDKFSQARVIRERSPLLSKSALKGAEIPAEQLAKAQAGVTALAALWADGKQPSFKDVLDSVDHTGIFEIPEGLQPYVGDVDLNAFGEEVADGPTGWPAMLLSDFGQIERYDEYISGLSPFDTHQAVKGREFPRVMVIISDTEARGFLFSYEKLFGAKERSATDLKNEADGSDTSIARTRRLFYVTCSRAEEGLAILAYSTNPDAVCRTVVENGWFEANEIIAL